MLHNVELNQSLQIRFPMVFLPRFFTFSSSSCLVFTTWSLKLHSGTKGPTRTKGPRGPKGTRGLRRMLWHDRNISKFVLNAIHFNQHGSYEFVAAFVWAWLSSFFLVGTRTKQLIYDLDAIYADGASCWWVMLAFHCKLTTVSTTEQNVLVCFPPCGHFQVELPAAPKAAAMSL